MLKNKRSATPTKEKSPPGKKLSSPDAKKNSKESEKKCEWIDRVREVVLVYEDEDNVDLGSWLLGGADEGEFPHIGERRHAPPALEVTAAGGVSTAALLPAEGDILLEVQGQKVSGYTLADVNAWIVHCLRSKNPVVVRTVEKGRSRCGCCCCCSCCCCCCNCGCCDCGCDNL